MKLKELLDPVAAAKEMEDLNQQMVDATGEYRALRTPASLKKIQDLEVKIKNILIARGKIYRPTNNGNIALKGILMKVNEVLAEGMDPDAAVKFYEKMKSAAQWQSANKDQHVKRDLYDAAKHIKGMTDQQKKTYSKEVALFQELCSKYGIK